MEEPKHVGVEKWANVAQRWYYVYLRRRFLAGGNDAPLSMDTVNKATKQMERLAKKRDRTEEEEKRLAAVREALWVRHESQ